MDVAKWDQISEEDAAAAVLLVDPGHYRTLDEIVREQTKGQGKLEVLELKKVAGGDDGSL